MMEVPLSTFLRFVSARGIAKVNKVLESQQEYEPYTDFYKRLRERAIEALQTGDLAELRRLPIVVPDTRKVPSYQLCAQGLERLTKRHEMSVLRRVDPLPWHTGELEVRVNPELVLKIDGETFLTKLYMGKEPLTKVAIQAFGYLVSQTHGKVVQAKPALLDLRRSRPRFPPTPDKRLEQLVQGEAASFIAMWRTGRVA